MTKGGPAAGSRLLVLGAGVFQLSIIRKARELGAYVITADNVPSNPGHRIANQSINCSTTETQKLIGRAIDLGIDGVVTAASDVAVPTVAAVRTTLGLPAQLSPALARNLSMKPAFREFLAGAGLSSQRYCFSNDFEKIKEEARNFTFPVVTKPADSSGSRGVIRVSEPVGLDDALRLSASFSRSGLVGAEELLAGVEYGGDLFLEGGRIKHLCVTDQYLREFTVRGHVLPSGVTPAVETLIRAALAELCSCLPYVEGPMNFDVKVDDQRVNLIEVSPRLGGNGIPELIRRANGLDFEAMVVLQALGVSGALEDTRAHGMAGSVVLGFDHDGFVGCLPDLEAVRSVAETAWGVHWAKPVGAKVGAMRDAGGMIGVAYFDCSDRTDYMATCHHLENWLNEVVCRDTAQ